MNRIEFRDRWRLSKEDFTNKEVDQIQKMVEHESVNFQIPIIKRAVLLVKGPFITY